MPGSEENAAPAEVSQEELTHVSEIVTDLIDKIIGNKDMARLRREKKTGTDPFYGSTGYFPAEGRGGSGRQSNGDLPGDCI